MHWKRRSWKPLTASAAFACLVAATAACQPAAVEQAGEPAAPELAPYETVWGLPLTTESEEARARFMQGLEANDLGRLPEARVQFQAAAAADPAFAIGHLYAAFHGNSFNEFVGSLKQAVEQAPNATPTEQAYIMSVQKAFENDDAASLVAAEDLMALAPESPRAALQVAFRQAAIGEHGAARATAADVVARHSGFVPAYYSLANSYLFNEPRDFAKAEEYASTIVTLAPDEHQSHDILGDVHRAQGNLEAAHADYTRAAELAPDDGGPLQQRGHVNSFLGNWEEARADYDRAIELAEPQVAANFGLWRGLVAVHEGDPEAAVAEFEAMLAGVDAMGLGDPISAKLDYLDAIAHIAAHHGMQQEAASAASRAGKLRMERIDATGAEENRNVQKAQTAWYEGLLAAHKGDYEGARAKAARFMELMADSTDPGKDEPAHEILGLAALLEGNAEEAVAHCEQADETNPYAKYHLGLAHEAAGNADAASEVFADLQAYNFNGTGYALIRADVLAR